MEHRRCCFSCRNDSCCTFCAWNLWGLGSSVAATADVAVHWFTLAEWFKVHDFRCRCGLPLRLVVSVSKILKDRYQNSWTLPVLAGDFNSHLKGSLFRRNKPVLLWPKSVWVKVCLKLQSCCYRCWYDLVFVKIYYTKTRKFRFVVLCQTFARTAPLAKCWQFDWSYSHCGAVTFRIITGWYTR